MQRTWPLVLACEHRAGGPPPSAPPTLRHVCTHAPTLPSPPPPASPCCSALVRGSFIGCVGIVLVVFFVGLTGILAAWAGLILPGEFGGPDFCEVIEPPTDYNLYFLAVRRTPVFRAHVCRVFFYQDHRPELRFLAATVRSRV